MSHSIMQKISNALFFFLHYLSSLMQVTIQTTSRMNSNENLIYSLFYVDKIQKLVTLHWAKMADDSNGQLGLDINA